MEGRGRPGNRRIVLYTYKTARSGSEQVESAVWEKRETDRSFPSSNCLLPHPLFLRPPPPAPLPTC